MTGYYVRVQADDGTFVSKDVAELTDSELDRFVASQAENAAARAWQWVKALAKWIRDNVKESPGEPV